MPFAVRVPLTTTQFLANVRIVPREASTFGARELTLLPEVRGPRRFSEK